MIIYEVVTRHNLRNEKVSYHWWSAFSREYFLNKEDAEAEVAKIDGYKNPDIKGELNEIEVH